MSTQPASEKRRREARARGQVAVSPLLCGAGALAGAALGLAWSWKSARDALLALAGRAWSGAASAGAQSWSSLAAGGAAASGTGAGEAGASGALAGGVGASFAPVVGLDEVLAGVAQVAVPIALAGLLGALLIGLAQTRGLLAGRAIGQPALARPPRLLPWALVVALVAIAYHRAQQLLGPLAQAGAVGPVAALAQEALAGGAARALLLFGGFGLGDWAWRRARLERALRMTRAELEQERREEEADPRMKAERRRRHEDQGTA